MASVTVTNVERFPSGTTVTAYPLSNWPTGAQPPSGAPVGSSTTSAVASGSGVTFTGLTDDTRYVAYASVNGQHRYVHFTTYRKRNPVQAVGTAASGDGLVWNDTSEVWEPAAVSTETETTAAIAAASAWLINIQGITTPTSNTGFTGLTATPTRRSSTSQNDLIGWKVWVPAGTWEFWLIHYAGSTRGIFSVTLGGNALTTYGAGSSTVDSYNAANASTESTIGGVVVAAAAALELRLTMSTKNASSSGYVGSVQAVGLRRTA